MLVLFGRSFGDGRSWLLCMTNPARSCCLCWLQFLTATLRAAHPSCPTTGGVVKQLLDERGERVGAYRVFSRGDDVLPVRWQHSELAAALLLLVRS